MSSLHFGAIKVADVRNRGFAFTSAFGISPARIYVVTKPSAGILAEKTKLAKGAIIYDANFKADVYVRQPDGSYVLERPAVTNPVGFSADGKNPCLNAVTISRTTEAETGSAKRIWVA